MDEQTLRDLIYTEHEWKNVIGKFIEGEDPQLYLQHYGVSALDGAPGRGSGRYPLGSGENPNQHSGTFYDRVNAMRKENPVYVDPDTGKEYHGDTAIAKIMNMSTTQFRAQYTISKNEEKEKVYAKAYDLYYNKGLSYDAVAKEMGYNNDSSIRSILNEGAKARRDQALVVRDYLKDVVQRSVDNGKGYIDIGKAAEKECGCSSTKLKVAIEMLKEEGYVTYTRGMKRTTDNNRQFNLTLLCPPGTQYKDVYDNSKVDSITDYEEVLINDGEERKPRFQYPASLDSSRVRVNYAETGGVDKDGLIELRRGVEDISLGNANYAQVRILVDGTHYIKGMAVYKDDMPEGVDVIFNTNKHEGTPMCGPKGDTVLKPIGKDPKNPFNSLIKEDGGQSTYIGEDGKEHLRVINKRADEGDWGSWNDLVAAQFLAKQPQKTIERQLNITLEEKQQELDDINSLTNPTVKKHLLSKFAEECDSASVHLKAAAFPRQKYQVILPLTTIKDDECYAPNFNDGETLYLVRYPHEGTFQIAKVKVNNSNKEGISAITPNAKDAIGISKNAAEKMSGADFDGDTVMVIPENRNFKITARDSLEGLKDFDDKMEYPKRPGSKVMTEGQKQREMGIISNLIMDMTLQNASDDELARATRHSMTVIDAPKHELDYKLSEEVNGIKQLKRKYQGHIDEDSGKERNGAATLLTRARNQQDVVKRQGQGWVNEKGKPWYDPNRPEGALVYKTSDKAYYNEQKKVKDPATGKYLKDPDTGKYIYEDTGKIGVRKQKSTKMAETDDAFTLVSEADTPQERAYARYANEMKRMANETRLQVVHMEKIEYSKTAAKAYAKEVKDLDTKLDLSERNAPRERKAHAIANSIMEAKKHDNPDMTKAEIKKHSQMALEEARLKVGAKRIPIEITDDEWAAIQAGAVSENKLSRILKYADTDRVRELAMPKANKELSSADIRLIQTLAAKGYTNAEIAQRLGVSASTVSKKLNA